MRPLGMRAHVTKDSRLEERAGCLYTIPDQPLTNELGASIGIAGTDRSILRHRAEPGLSIDRCRRAEHYAATVSLPHHLQQGGVTAYIDVVIAGWQLCTFRNGLQCCQMNHRIWLEPLKAGQHRRAVADVEFVHCQWLASDELDPLDDPVFAVAEILHHLHVVTSRDQLHHGVGSDKAGTAGNQHFPQAFSLSKPCRACVFTLMGRTGTR